MRKVLNYKILLSFFGVVLLALILIYVVDIKAFGSTLKEANYWYFIPIFVLSFFLLGFKAWRWQLLMRRLEINYPLTDSLAIYSVAVFLSLVTPGKIGEVAKIFYLKQDNHPLASSLVTIIVDRLLDFFFLLFLMFVGFLSFIHFFNQELIYFVVIILLGVLGTYILFKFKLYIKLTKFIMPQRYHHKIFANLQSFFNGFKKYRSKDYLSGFILTLLAWLVYIVQIYLLGLSLSLQLNFLFLIPMIAVANATDLLPISFNGLGTREAVFIFFFALINLTSEKAVALGILQLFIVLSTALIGFGYWIKRPINLKTYVTQNAFLSSRR